MRTIKVCAGIGDNIWLLQKLVNAGEKFDFELPDGKPMRGKQIFDLLPQVANSATYVKGLNYRTLAAKTHPGNWADAKGDIYLSCNTHLEAGKKLVDFLPDLPISYKLKWNTGPDVPMFTEYGEVRSKFIGIYGSAYSTQRAWKQYGAWGVDEWIRLIGLMHEKDPSYTFVIIGAEWDNDFATELTVLLRANNIPYINTIGEPLTSFMQWVKLFTYAFYFPSGLPILSETIHGSSDCCMFYTSNIAGILGTWADPARIEAGNIKECLFCSPALIFDWCLENNKL